MPSPRRNGKRGEDKPVVIIMPNSPIGYLCGMPLSGEEVRCIKFANKKEARAWIINHQMASDMNDDARLCVDILRQIDEGKKVIRCDSCFTYGPSSIWTGHSHLYDCGIDLGPAGETIITARRGAESAYASESTISSAHDGSSGAFDHLDHIADRIYRQPPRDWYEPVSVTPSPDLFVPMDDSPITRRSVPAAVSGPAEDSGPAVEEMAQPGQTGQTDAIGPNLRAALDGFRASRMASESASDAVVDAANEERVRQRYIEEFLSLGHDPMSYCEGDSGAGSAPG